MAIAGFLGIDSLNGSCFSSGLGFTERQRTDV
jgi:hypothetical protein